MSVTHAYTTVKKPTQQTTAIATVRLILKRYMRRPAKKRKRERCSSSGNTSTGLVRCDLSRPSEKNARIRARAWGLSRGG
jgi:hypothetical protein